MTPIIDLFLDDRYLTHSILKWVSWDMEKSPHCILCGQSGSGKTYASKILLAKIAQAVPCEIYVLDAKSDSDFDFLNGQQHFYRYDRCGIGLYNFFERFIRRQNGTDHTRHPLIFFFDEWSSYCNMEKRNLLKKIKRN